VTGPRLLALLFVLTLPLVGTRVRGADEIEYFSYLRSLAFDGDLDFENEYRHFYERDPQGLAGFRATFLERREAGTGRPINFAPLGSALLWSPLYAAAHAGVLLARAFGAGVAADGFSAPYLAAACYASALWGFLGLLLVHDALRRFFEVPEPFATGTVVALWLGTPVLYYMTVAPAFAHASSLFAVALLLWLWLRAVAAGGGGVRDWAAIGAAAGLCALVREQDGFFVVVPGLWLVTQTLARRDIAFGLVRAAALGLAALVVFTPQLLAYRAINGSFGPSPLVKRKMTWWSPHFFEVLFDPGNGLFAWSPLLFVATVGLAVALWRRRDLRLGLLALGLCVQVLINGAVESWSQAGAFGSRRFVGATLVFACGLGLLAAGAATARARRAMGAALLLFVWWNVSLMVQFGLKLMDRQRLRWPDVAVNQVTAVPGRLAQTVWLYLTDRERLVKAPR
jgi:hypothetical protein